MILVDTSVWVDHFRHRSLALVELLDQDRVLAHPFVIGELALSGLRRREEILGLIASLPRAIEAGHEEVVSALERFRLDGRGVGWVDAHLFTSARLSTAQLWTADKSLRAVCGAAGLAFRAP